MDAQRNTRSGDGSTGGSGIGGTHIYPYRKLFDFGWLQDDWNAMNRTLAVVVALALVGVTVFAPTAAAQSSTDTVGTADAPTQGSLDVVATDLGDDPVVGERHINPGGNINPGVCGNGNRLGCVD